MWRRPHQHGFAICSDVSYMIKFIGTMCVVFNPICQVSLVTGVPCAV